MKRASKAYISINAHVIRRNAIHGTEDPPIRIARGKSDRAPRYAREVAINGPSKLVYDAHNRIMKCGARLVLEADADSVEVVR